MTTSSSATERLCLEVERATESSDAAKTLLIDFDDAVEGPRRGAGVSSDLLGALGCLLEDGWRVVLVSGRPAADILRCVPFQDVRVYGDQGLDGLDADVHAAVREVSARIAAVARDAVCLLRQFPAAEIVAQPFGVVFHERTLTGRAAETWRRAVRSLLLGSDLEGLTVQAGRCSLELRPARFHKALVAREVLSRLRTSRFDASLVALGDDTADEDVFREVRGIGLTIRVGRSKRRTWAEHTLDSPRDIAGFIGRLSCSRTCLASR
jgi:alpha,alpha-trehalase